MGGHDELARIAAMLQRRGGWLVIDEAFVDTDPALSSAALCKDFPIVVLRSFGKFYGLAGVRLGFAVAAPDLARRIAAALGPWACSGSAIHIGTKALRDESWAMQTRVALATQAIKLDAILNKAGFISAGGTALFRLVRHPDAMKLHRRLAQHHIWCRSFDWASDLLRFGLPPDRAALDRVAAALAE
jgi:cobalamin biosynthetic protein CobC